MKAEDIKKIVDQYFGLDISSKSRIRPYPDARKIYSLICFKEFGYKDENIANPIKRDRSTIIIQKRTAADLLETDLIFKKDYDYCVRKIKRHYEKLNNAKEKVSEKINQKDLSVLDFLSKGHALTQGVGDDITRDMAYGSLQKMKDILDAKSQFQLACKAKEYKLI